MRRAAGEEIRSIRGFVADAGREIIVVCVATLCLILMRYHPTRAWWLTNVLYFAAIPLFAITMILRRNPLAFGLRAGDIRRGAFHAAVGCLAGAAVVLIAAHLPSIRQFYGRESAALGPYVAKRIVIIASLEFFFRGFLLFGLRDRFGRGAVLVQMMPFAIRHVGKSEAEAIGCILSGLYLGYVAYRSNAVWPAFVIHLFVNVFNVAINAI
jgi:membrane protease YdiL (CAAX protease family)